MRFFNKYHNKKIIIDGEKFDSKKEYNRYLELKEMESNFLITDLQRQVKFELIPKQKDERACFYIADFVYIQNDKKIVEDTKGFKTPEYIIKRKLFKHIYIEYEFIES